MDFAKLLQTVKDNLDLHETEQTEEEEKTELEASTYNDSLVENTVSYLSSIKYFKKPVHILNKTERYKLNKTYKHINPIGNEYNSNNEITKIKELNVSTMTIFVQLNCDTVNMKTMRKYACETCNVLGCDKSTCSVYKPTSKAAASKKDEKFTCLVKLDNNTQTKYPLKGLKQFDNQYSCYVQIKNHGDIIPYFNDLKNKKKRDTILKPRVIKIFQNGGITILGVKSFEHGLSVAQQVVFELNKIYQTDQTIVQFPESDTKTDATSTKTEIQLITNGDDYVSDTHLINATYYVDFNIDREKLHKLLINKYGLSNCQCCYRPDNYPAVSIKFYWNMDNKYNGKFGICNCTRCCNGKGNGKGNGQCRSITITVFESGSISFMGARHEEQLTDCYHFINSILNMEYTEIYKKPPTIIKPKRKKMLKIKKTPKIKIKKAPKQKKLKKRIKIKKTTIKNIKVYHQLKLTV
jgi:hypothetical protein